MTGPTTRPRITAARSVDGQLCLVTGVGVPIAVRKKQDRLLVISWRSRTHSLAFQGK
jgi:hypothetical protein